MSVCPGCGAGFNSQHAVSCHRPFCSNRLLRTELPGSRVFLGPALGQGGAANRPGLGSHQPAGPALPLLLPAAKRPKLVLGPREAPKAPLAPQTPSQQQANVLREVYPPEALADEQPCQLVDDSSTVSVQDLSAAQCPLAVEPLLAKFPALLRQSTSVLQPVVHCADAASSVQHLNGEQLKTLKLLLKLNRADRAVLLKKLRDKENLPWRTVEDFDNWLMPEQARLCF